MAGVLYYANKTFPQLTLLDDPLLLGALFGGVFMMGIVITWFSTFLATQRFLNLRTEELYY
jgi:cell division transport system permease protein